MRLRLPHPLLLLLGAVAVAMFATWIIPAGTYQRKTDQASGREVVVAGTYQRVEQAPVGPTAAVIAIPRGIISGADVILTILFVGAAFALLDSTGALARIVASLVGSGAPPRLVVVGISIGFAILGGLENMDSEIIALAGVLVLLSRGLGFGAITALAMSIGASLVGAAFGPLNPFQTGIGLKFSELPGLSMAPLRFALYGATVATWIAYTLYMIPKDDQKPETAPAPAERASMRDVVLVALALVPFVPYVIGVLKYDFGFNELTALFLVAGFAIGLVSGRSWNQTAIDLLKGMEGMLAAGLMMGVARAISVVLTDGKVIDSIIHGLATPLGTMPSGLGALAMIPVHALLHIAVPSVSGHGVLTMPIMAPTADLIHVSRDAAVIAYQTGSGLMDLITPTNGILLAILVGAKVGYGRWIRFAGPGTLLVALVGAAGVVLAR